MKYKIKVDKDGQLETPIILNKDEPVQFEISHSYPDSEDNVNHPKHYTSSNSACSNCGHTIECIDVTRHMNFNLGNVVKYVWRSDLKNGLEDLKKARWYLEDEIKSNETI